MLQQNDNNQNFDDEIKKLKRANELGCLVLALVLVLPVNVLAFRDRVIERKSSTSARAATI